MASSRVTRDVMTKDVMTGVVMQDGKLTCNKRSDVPNFAWKLFDLIVAEIQRF